MKPLINFFLVIALSALTHLNVSAQTYDINKSLKGFDQYIQKVMKDWNAPGLAVGIVVGDKLVFAKGYGYRDLEKKLPVTPTTLFPIASNTKLFTTVAAGFLVDEGKLSWDKPIKKFDPSIEFYNEELNNAVTLRDMLSHRTGISRHDWIWYKSDFSRKELFDRLKFLEPSQPLRQGYLYNNLMYAGVGSVIENLTGKTWEDFVTEKIFYPMNMRSSVFTIEEMEKQADFAFPYYEKRDTTLLTKLPFYREQQGIGPAGAIISSVNDISKWLVALMNKGKVGDKQVIPENILKASLEPAVANPNVGLESKGYKEILNPVYGMGRGYSSYKGHYLTNHGGAIGGFYSQVSCMPYDNLGVIVFVNGSHNYPLVNIISYHIYDRLLNLEQTAWHERALKDYLDGKKAAKESRQKQGSDKVADTRPTHNLEEYAGEFEHSAYGIVKINYAGGQLQFDFHKIVLPLIHYHYNRFDTPDDPLDGKWSVNFSVNPQGEVDKLLVSLDQSEVTFTRKPEAALLNTEVLLAYTGKYQTASGTPIEVKLNDGSVLYLQVPGQPMYQLIPTKERKFKMKEFSDVSIEFIMEKGKVIGYKVSDPSGERFNKKI